MEEIRKQAVVKALTLEAGDLEQINRQALKPLEERDVFAFRVLAADTRVDREHERFSKAALEEMAALFVGRPVIIDHKWSSKGITARIYGGSVERDGTAWALILRAYIPRGEDTESTIAAIETGLLREVSVGVAVSHAVCSVCGADRAVSPCGHIPGRAYEGELCVVELSGVTDAYELSFVVVPAQPRAGVVKRYTGGVGPSVWELARAGLELEQARYTYDD